MPEEIFLDKWYKMQKANKEEVFSTLAEEFKVSPLVIAVRARNFDLISEEEYQKFYNDYLQQIKQIKPREHLEYADFYLRCKKIFSSQFVRCVIDALNNDFISFREAMDYLNLYGSTFDNFIKSYLLESKFG